MEYRTDGRLLRAAFRLPKPPGREDAILPEHPLGCHALQDHALMGTRHATLALFPRELLDQWAELGAVVLLACGELPPARVGSQQRRSLRCSVLTLKGCVSLRMRPVRKTAAKAATSSVRATACKAARQRWHRQQSW